ncbi:MAG: DUF1800 domain-containing protein [Myxococcota bacterium]
MERLTPTLSEPLLRATFLVFATCSGCTPGLQNEQADEGGPPTPVVPRPLEPGSGDTGFIDAASTNRLLTQATFGPTREDITSFTGSSASSWFRQQVALPPTTIRPVIERYRAYLFGPDAEEFGGELFFETTNFAFWENAIGAPDQLRQRMAFALSQIFVVSNAVGDELTEHPEIVAYLQDRLITHAFGNFRTILEEVTYSPAMAIYLTYLDNQKADPDTGRVPDENYAREILQLFSIGTVELKRDGTPKLDDAKLPIETYNNRDITGLAKVFTGLGLDFDSEDDLWDAPLVMSEASHSTAEKSFLGQRIPAGTPGQESIRRALDIIFDHPNVGPFISRQLIQRFVTSDPKPAYVERVGTAFNRGRFVLPNGETVGAGQRGDLEATLAAILFDDEARTRAARQDDRFGKIREPVIRLTHFARAFDADASRVMFFEPLWNPDMPLAISQVPYQSPSVFNFYRPGFVAPGTSSGRAGMTVPELQIMSPTTIPGDANLLQHLVFRNPGELAFEEAEHYFEEILNLRIDRGMFERTLVPNYGKEQPLAPNPSGLVEDLDGFLAYGSMSAETKRQIVEILSAVENDDELRVRLAVYLVMTSEDYLVQR